MRKSWNCSLFTELSQNQACKTCKPLHTPKESVQERFFLRMLILAYKVQQTEMHKPLYNMIKFRSIRDFLCSRTDCLVESQVLRMAFEKMGVAGYIDVETTGLNPATDEIIELSIVLFEFDRETAQIHGVIEEYTGLREPSVPISAEASSVNGIRFKDVAGRSLDHQRVTELIDRAEFLVAHNANFDLMFVGKMFDIAWGKNWFCSMRGVNWKKKGFSSRKLQYLLDVHGIRDGVRHRADSDVRNAILLLSQQGPDGTYYFKEILKSRPVLRGEAHRAVTGKRKHVPSSVNHADNHAEDLSGSAEGNTRNREIAVATEQIMRNDTTADLSEEEQKYDGPNVWIIAAVVVLVVVVLFSIT